MLSICRLTRFTALLFTFAATLLLSSSNVLAQAGEHMGGGRHRHHPFRGRGTWNATEPGPCATGMCFSAGGQASINSMPATFSANGTYDPNLCRTRGRRTCCQETMDGEFHTSDGDVEFSFVGRGCTSPKMQTLMGHMEMTGVSGTLDGQTGKAVFSARSNPQTGQGGICRIRGSMHQ